MSERITRQQLEMKTAYLAELLGYATKLEMDGNPALVLTRHAPGDGHVRWHVDVEAIGVHSTQRDIFGGAHLSTSGMWHALCFACDAARMAKERYSGDYTLL